VLEVYEPEALDVELVTASGHTGALVTLTAADVRAAEETDSVTVRTLARTA
jgi:hypothetical protein